MMNDSIQDTTALSPAPYRPGVPMNPAIEIAASAINDHYLDMPGLSLTSTQVLRLFNMPPALGSAALQLLVDTGTLTRTASGTFVRRF